MNHAKQPRGWISLALVVGFAFAVGAAGSATASAQGWRDRDRDRWEQDRWESRRNSRWTYLGEAHVDGREDHDRITIDRNGRGLRALQLRVERAPIEFYRVVVHYANGSDEVLNLRDRIPAGGQTRAIDLRGGDRAVTSVEFWYARGSRRSVEPKVRLFGR